MNIDKVIIIGGGIGGLSLTAALERHGIECRVYEQSEVLREVGAGISLWSNAIALLEKLGYTDMLEELGAQLTHGGFVSPSGRVLAQYRVDELLEGASVDARPRIVHRGALLEMLAEGVDPGRITTGKRCERVEWESPRPVVHFADGTSDRADLIVGADGIWSRVRASLWGEEPPRYSGEYCLRGIALGAESDLGYLRELHGKGRRFGVGALDDNLTYWWATWATGVDFELAEEDYIPFLLDRFAGWPCNIPGLIEATKPADIHLDGLYDRPPLQSWSRKGVTLLGDAAHPTTPNLGQGGCMAIEDAAVLAELLATADTLDAALSRYEQLRIPRTSKLVREARRFGKLGQWRNPVAVWLREKMIAWTPERIMRNQLLDKVAYDALASVRG